MLFPVMTPDFTSIDKGILYENSVQPPQCVSILEAESIVSAIFQAVKELQKVYSLRNAPFCDQDAEAVQLCFLLEVLFLHGLKSTEAGSLNLYLPSECHSCKRSFLRTKSFFHLLVQIVPNAQVDHLLDLRNIETGLGRCRSWIRNSLNQRQLTNYFDLVSTKEHSLVKTGGKGFLEKYYWQGSSFLSHDLTSILKNILLGVETIPFQFSIDDTQFDDPSLYDPILSSRSSPLFHIPNPQNSASSIPIFPRSEMDSPLDSCTSISSSCTHNEFCSEEAAETKRQKKAALRVPEISLSPSSETCSTLKPRLDDSLSDPFFDDLAPSSKHTCDISDLEETEIIEASMKLALRIPSVNPASPPHTDDSSLSLTPLLAPPSIFSDSVIPQEAPPADAEIGSHSCDADQNLHETFLTWQEESSESDASTNEPLDQEHCESLPSYYSSLGEEHAEKVEALQKLSSLLISPVSRNDSFGDQKHFQLESSPPSLDASLISSEKRHVSLKSLDSSFTDDGEILAISSNPGKTSCKFDKMPAHADRKVEVYNILKSEPHFDEDPPITASEPDSELDSPGSHLAHFKQAGPHLVEKHPPDIFRPKTNSDFSSLSSSSSSSLLVSKGQDLSGVECKIKKKKSPLISPSPSSAALLSKPTPSKLPQIDVNSAEFSLMLNQLLDINHEIGVDSQNYQCAECPAKIGLTYRKYYLCHFDGLYYCGDCFYYGSQSENSSSSRGMKSLLKSAQVMAHMENFDCEHHTLIVSRVIKNWDFRKYPVSNRSFRFIQTIYKIPLFDIEELNPFLLRPPGIGSTQHLLSSKLNVYLRANIANPEFSSLSPIPNINFSPCCRNHVGGLARNSPENGLFSLTKDEQDSISLPEKTGFYLSHLFRKKVFLAYQYILPCQHQNSPTRHLLTLFKSRTHFLSDYRFYSLQDLSDIHYGILGPLLNQAYQYVKNQHILLDDCSHCKSRASSCEYCESSELLFPFDIEQICRCHTCGKISHLRCAYPPSTFQRLKCGNCFHSTTLLTK